MGLHFYDGEISISIGLTSVTLEMPRRLKTCGWLPFWLSLFLIGLSTVWSRKVQNLAYALLPGDAGALPRNANANEVVITDTIPINCDELLAYYQNGHPE